MNQDVKKLWVEDLRANGDKQGRHGLHNLENNTFCCLGRLCELAISSGVEVETGIDSGTPIWSTYDGRTGYPPESVCNWAGIGKGKDIVVTIAGSTNSLPAHNDSGASFAQIADAIESQL